MAGRIALVHGSLYLAGFYGCVETAVFFHCKEQLPSLLGNSHGQVLDVVRTGSRVDNLVEMRFLFQEQLLVACQTFGEFIGNGIRLVERNNRHGVDACKSGTHSLGLRTQQVYVRIEQSKVESGRFRMYSHLGSTAAFVVFALVFAVAQAFRIIGSHDIGPQHTGSAEFCYFKEVIGTDTEIKLYLLGYQSCRQSGIGQLVHVFITPSQRVAQFLIDICTGIVQRQRIHVQDTVFRKHGGSFNQSLGSSHHIALFLAFGKHLVEIIVVNGTLQLREVIIFLLEITDQKLCQFHHVSLTSGEIQFYALRTDVFQQSFDILRTQFFGFHVERERIDTLVQNVQRLGIGCFGRFHLYFLTDEPLIIVFLCTSKIRELTGKSIRGL